VAKARSGVKGIALLVVVISVFCGAPAAASAHNLPWKALDRMMTSKLQGHSDALAKEYPTNGEVWGRWKRVSAKPHFGQYWAQVYGYVYGTECYYTCGLETKFYFTCVSWVNFRYARANSTRVSISTVKGDCYSFWIENLNACGGGPCIPGFSPGDSRPPYESVPASHWEWTRFWKYWPTILNPPI
jgi:hypothetical protein